MNVNEELSYKFVLRLLSSKTKGGVRLAIRGIESVSIRSMLVLETMFAAPEVGIAFAETKSFLR